MTTPSDSRFPFEVDTQRVIDRTRREGPTPSPAGYESSANEILTLPGDETAPYSHALARASSDGTAGSVTVADGQAQRVLTDLLGRIWTLPAPGGIQMVEGDIANDAVDSATSNPVKIGGVAVATFAGQTAVAAGDRTNAAFDLNGRQLVVPQGNVAHDAVDSGQPVKVGGRAAATGGFAAVAVADRSDIATDVNGRLLVNVDNWAAAVVANIQGNIANDAPDAGSLPVKVGGIAVATFAGQAVAVATDDRVNAAYDVNGRQLVVPQGNVAHDAVDSGQPLKIGGRAVADPLGFAVVAAADRTDAAFDLQGKLITAPQGNVAHDAVDSGNPVKVGSRAAADSNAGFAAVAAGDRSDLALDPNGRVLTVSQGNVAADAPNVGNPVGVGGVAGDPTTGLAAVSLLGDRANLAVDLSGRPIVLAQGNVAHDAVDAGFPLKDGGYAADEAPATVSAVGDRVNGYYDRQGRKQVNQEKAIAGENLALNVLRTVRGKVPVEQESWLDVVINNVSSQAIKAAAGRLGRIQFLNTSATALYVLLHDATNPAALGPILWRGWLPAAAAGTPGVLEIGFEEADGLYFEIGISFSTSTGIFAIAGAVAVYGNALYV